MGWGLPPEVIPVKKSTVMKPFRLRSASPKMFIPPMPIRSPIPLAREFLPRKWCAPMQGTACPHHSTLALARCHWDYDATVMLVTTPLQMITADVCSVGRRPLHTGDRAQRPHERLDCRG